MRLLRSMRLVVATAMLGSTAAGWAAEPPDDADPANLPPPPAGALGYPSRDPNLDALPGFLRPPPGYGAVAFHWWQGEPLTKERLAWQIEQLAGKHVMGLQINYAHDGTMHSYASQPPLFSEAWWELFRWYLGECKRHGMTASLSDYTLVTPPNGCLANELLAEDPGLRASALDAAMADVSGNATIQLPCDDDTICVRAYRRYQGAADPDESLDLTPLRSGGQLRWTAPAGNWTVVRVFCR
jgi:hypothetical protein